MALIKWAPMIDTFGDVDKFFDDLKPFMRGTPSLTPAVDIYDKKDEIVAEIPLPGVDINNIGISIENDVLTIESSDEKTTEVDEKNYYRKEVRTGSFHRVVQLPVSVNADVARADYENGVLTITVPKREEAKPKNVKVNIIK